MPNTLLPVLVPFTVPFLARPSAGPSSPSATVGHRLIKPHPNSEWCDFDSGARGHSAAVFDFIEEALDLDHDRCKMNRAWSPSLCFAA